MNGRTPQQLQATLNKKFNMVELRQLAFSLNIDDENLESNTKQEFIISLIKYAQRHDLFESLWKQVEKHQNDRPNVSKTSFWDQLSFGTKLAIVSVVVTVISIFVTLMSMSPGSSDDAQPNAIVPTMADKILVQVKVVSLDDQTALDNAKVSIVLADELFPQQRTDSTGLVIFELPTDANGQVASISVEVNGQVETQIIAVTFGLRPIEFQLRP